MSQARAFFDAVREAVGEVNGFVEAEDSSTGLVSVAYRYVGPRAAGMDVTIVMSATEEAGTARLEVSSVVSDSARRCLRRLLGEVKEMVADLDQPGSYMFDGRPILPASAYFEIRGGEIDPDYVMQAASLLCYCLNATPELCIMEDAGE